MARIEIMYPQKSHETHYILSITYSVGDYHLEVKTLSTVVPVVLEDELARFVLILRKLVGTQLLEPEMEVQLRPEEKYFYDDMILDTSVDEVIQTHDEYGRKLIPMIVAVQYQDEYGNIHPVKVTEK